MIPVTESHVVILSNTPVLTARDTARTFGVPMSQRGQSKRVRGRAGLRCGEARKRGTSEPGAPHGPFVRGTTMPRYTLSARERFDTKYIQEPNTGCWLWMDATDKDGYGVFYYGGYFRAHRAAWVLYRGPLTKGLVIDHTCHTPLCVNPDHLREVTVRQNTIENSNGRAAVNHKKTHCPKCGGPFTPRPAWKSCGPSRKCKRCFLAYAAQYHRVRRAAVRATRKTGETP